MTGVTDDPPADLHVDGGFAEVVEADGLHLAAIGDPPFAHSALSNRGGEEAVNDVRIDSRGKRHQVDRTCVLEVPAQDVERSTLLADAHVEIDVGGLQPPR